MQQPKPQTRWRDAITGLFTSRRHAEANPHTTVREREKVRPRGRRIQTEDLPCLHSTATRLASSAAIELVSRSDYGAVMNPADALRSSDGVTRISTTPTGVRVTVTVQVEADEGTGRVG